MTAPKRWISLPDRWRQRVFADEGAVLLESTLPSAEQHRSFLFVDPVKSLVVYDASEIPPFFDGIRAAHIAGHYLAGYLTYEFGCLLQGTPLPNLPKGFCFAKFGIYRAPQVFDHTAAQQLHDSPSPRDGLPLAMLPEITPAAYADKIHRVQEYIRAGDTYQVNLTTAVRSQHRGELAHAYDRIALEQPCSYAAVLRLDDDCTILSFSPELFFQTDASGNIAMRPMKGTARHDADAAAAAQALQKDEKNRAEHVMIVDLLRNDLGRVCETGSVHTPELFHVETYPTVHQMVSTVQGRLRRDVLWQQIFTSLFPSGSITGAPKRRTMQIIHELEDGPRGVYTGAIGYIAPNGSSAFSVAIRTLECNHGEREHTVRMGVGGGVVADSTSDGEWQECLLKTSFLHRSSEPLYLIETMLVQEGELMRYARHRRRLLQSAEALGFAADSCALDAAVGYAIQNNRGPGRMRLTLDREGTVHVDCQPLQPWPSTLKVRISALRIDAADPSLRYKTTARHVYDENFAAARRDGYDEALFFNTAGELTEGCVTNVLIYTDVGLITPALHCGVLPGVYRQLLLDAELAHEGVLTLQSLREARAVFVCNSVREIVPVGSILLVDGTTLMYDTAVGASTRQELLAAVY